MIGGEDKTERQTVRRHTNKPANSQTETEREREINDKWLETGHTVVQSGRSIPVHPCGLTTTQTCEPLQQSHRILGDTYIKQLPFLFGSLSHGGACETGALCCCYHSLFPTPLSLALSGWHHETTTQTLRLTPCVYHPALAVLWSVSQSVKTDLATLPSQNLLTLLDLMPASPNLCAGLLVEPLPPPHTTHWEWPEVSAWCAAVERRGGGGIVKSADYIGTATHMTSQSQFQLTALCLCQTPMLPLWRKQHNLR